MSYAGLPWYERPAPGPGYVYCHGCEQAFLHIDGCPDCHTDAYLEKIARYS